MDDYARTKGSAPEVPGFDVGRCLGRGGNATVWLVTERQTGSEYALKCFPAGDGLERGDAEEAIRREVRILSVLDHEHLVRAHSVVRLPGGQLSRSGDDDGDDDADADWGEAVGLIMDYAAGGSVEQLVAGRGELGPGETVTVLTPIAQALAYLHGQGFTHGDVSPGNVLFTAHGKPLLADLGVARMVADATAVADAGTDGFRDPAPVDAVRAGLQPERDVYSLAALGWYCLTGRAPEPGAQRPPLPLLVPGVPAELAAALESGLHEDRRLRPSAAELAIVVHRSAVAAPVDLSVSVHPTVIPQLLTRRSLPATARERRVEQFRVFRRRFHKPRVAWPPPPGGPSGTGRPSRNAGARHSARSGLAASDAARTGAARQDAVRLGAARSDAARPDAARSGVAASDAARSGAARQDAVRFGAARSGAARSDAVRLGAARTGAARRNPSGRRGFRAAAVGLAVLAVLVAGWGVAGSPVPPVFRSFAAMEAEAAKEPAPAVPDPAPEPATPAMDAAAVPPEVRAQLDSQNPEEAVRGLAWLRSLAFSTGDFRLLDQVNVPASSAAVADGRISAGLEESGRVLAGFTTVVTQTAATEDSGGLLAVVAVTVSTSAYWERDASGVVVGEAAAVPEQRLRLVLAPVEGRWRIQDILPASTGTPDAGGAAAGTPDAGS
ncbi:protein kinase [Arthrobacter sp. YAF17]|uniref:protein kinase domain-containing protein n=1 Tax=Arthrobacter sp. YAF17 TaxID=3233077 RepID=UPI003F8F7130